MHLLWLCLHSGKGLDPGRQDQWTHMAGEEGQQRGLVEAKRDKNLLSREERVGTWRTDGPRWNPTRVVGDCGYSPGSMFSSSPKTCS